MSLVMKRTLIGLIIALCLAVFYWAVTYHGTWPTPSFINPATLSKDRLVSEARRLRGIAYDPLMGQHDNIGGRSGLIVCVDVPLLAYWNSGYSLRQALDADFPKHHQFYDTRGGNKPGNPFFHRRARN